MKGQGWTSDEKERAVSLFEAGKTCAEIGAELNRTRKSVHTMLVRRKHGARASRILMPWSAEDVARLQTMRAEGKKAQEIADALGRHITHIYSKMRYLDMHIPHRVDSVEVPAKTAAEWRERLSVVPRTITAMLCGDPPPGYSALDRRRP